MINWIWKAQKEPKCPLDEIAVSILLLFVGLEGEVSWSYNWIGIDDRV